jgi:flavin reductase
MEMQVTSQSFRGALSLLTGAVTLITTDGEAGRAGFTASAVCSVTDDPPTVLVCMRSAAPSNPIFRANGVLCVNVLSASQQHLSGSFANAQLSAQARFAMADWSVLQSGAPALDQALINLDCQIVETHVVGTHDICICRVQDIRSEARGDGLVYFGRTYHHLKHNEATQ